MEPITATYIARIKTGEVSITAKTVLYWTGSRRGSLRSVQHPALTFQSARHDYLETGPSVPNRRSAVVMGQAGYSRSLPCSQSSDTLKGHHTLKCQA